MKGYRRQSESIVEKLGGKINCIAMAIFAAVAITAGILWMDAEDAKARDAQYFDSWPITMNQYIEWEWAGKCK